MSQALPGEHYCREHQGNHSHYDPKNCTVCKLQAKLRKLEVEYGNGLPSVLSVEEAYNHSEYKRTFTFKRD